MQTEKCKLNLCRASILLVCKTMSCFLAVNIVKSIYFRGHLHVYKFHEQIIKKIDDKAHLNTSSKKSTSKHQIMFR